MLAPKSEEEEGRIVGRGFAVNKGKYSVYS